MDGDKIFVVTVDAIAGRGKVHLRGDLVEEPEVADVLQYLLDNKAVEVISVGKPEPNRASLR